MMHGPFTQEQQIAFDACERSLARGEPLELNSLHDEIEARVFVDLIQHEKEGTAPVDPQKLNSLRSELFMMKSQDAAAIVTEARELASKADPLMTEGEIGILVGKISREGFNFQFREKIRESLREVLKSGIFDVSPVENNLQEDQNQDQDGNEEPPPGLDRDKHRSKFEAWQEGGGNFEPELAKFLSECGDHAMQVSENEKEYFGALTENVRAIAAQGQETPYPKYYLNVARGFWKYLVSLVETGFQFSGGYENLGKFSLGAKGMKGKIVPPKPHNILEETMRYADSDDNFMLLEKLFDGMPLICERLFVDKNRHKVPLPLYRDALDGTKEKYPLIFCIRKTTAEENEAKDLPLLKELKKRWPHLRLW